MINYLEYDAKSGYVIIHSPNKNNLVQIISERIRQLCSPRFGDYVDICCRCGKVPASTSYFDGKVETTIEDDDYIDVIYTSKIPFIYKDLVLYYDYHDRKFYLYKTMIKDHVEKKDVKVIFNAFAFDPVTLSHSFQPGLMRGFKLLYIKVFRLRTERINPYVGTEDQRREEFKIVLAAMIHEMVMYNISSNL